MKRFFCKTLLLAFVTACASDSYLSSKGHRAFNSRDYSVAAQEYAKTADVPGVNQFLFLVDLATTYFAAGDYELAIQYFLKAEKISEIKDYTSLSEEAGTLLTSDNVRGYTGEDFEKVLINVYLALSFAALEKWESAQVEARKINLLLYRMINEGKRNYQESPFARYLSGLLWETTQEWNSAYIDYKKTHELDPKFPFVGADLLTASNKMRFTDEYKEWSRIFENQAPRKIPDGWGEFIVIFEQGLSPRKIPRDGHNSSLPRFVPRGSDSSYARVWIGDKDYIIDQKVLDIEKLSIAYLEDRIGRMIAKKMAGAAVKGALAAGLGSSSKDSDLGFAVFHLLMALDRADLRSWLTLPGSFKMERIAVPSGKYPIRLQVLNRYSEVIYEKNYGEVELKPRHKKFLIGR